MEFEAEVEVEVEKDQIIIIARFKLAPDTWLLAPEIKKAPLRNSERGHPKNRFYPYLIEIVSV